MAWFNGWTVTRKAILPDDDLVLLEKSFSALAFLCKAEIERELIDTRTYKAGYEVRHERWRHDDSEPWTDMKVAYTPEGHYIGTSKWAHRLINRYGIKPEPRPHQDAMEGTGDKVCCIGFSEKNQKWYGWSHRAICGFGVGDKIENDDHLCTHSGWTQEYLDDHPEEDVSLPVGFEARSLDDARAMAIAFADAVS
jgi:hypothetical protein